MAGNRIFWVCIGISMIGLLLTASALVVQLIRLPSTPGVDGMTLLVREYVLSPATVLLVYLMLWIERLAPLVKAFSQLQSSPQSAAQPERWWSRFARWFSFGIAWVATSVALMVLTPFNATIILILCAALFGCSMWLLEARLRHQP